MCALFPGQEKSAEVKVHGMSQSDIFISYLEPVEVGKSQQEPLIGSSAEQLQLAMRQTQPAAVRHKIMTVVRESAWSKRLRKSSWMTENIEQGVPVSCKHEESEIRLLYFLTWFCKFVLVLVFFFSDCKNIYEDILSGGNLTF